MRVEYSVYFGKQISQLFVISIIVAENSTNDKGETLGFLLDKCF